MIAVAGIPLAVAGWSAIRLSDDALTNRASALHNSTVQLLAERIGDDVRAKLRAVQLAASAIDLQSLGPHAQLMAQRLVFRQIDGASVVALFDKNGNQATRPVYLAEPSADKSLTDRTPLTDIDIQAFAAHLPLDLAVQVGSAIGLPFVCGDSQPHVAIAVRAKGDYILAVGVSLARLVDVIEAYQVGERSRAFAVDLNGNVVLAADTAAVARRENRSAWPAVRAALSGAPVPTRSFEPEIGDVFTAGARIPDLGWAVIVSEPALDTLAASRTLTRQTTLWFALALIAAIALGLLSSRAITRPIRALHQGTSALQRGLLDYRVDGADRRDELGDLARAFNEMAEELQRWGRQLEQRVDERTYELRESHELLSRTQKLAAVGQLGAGVAHEINNPLTAILGMAELMLEEDPAPDDKSSLQVIYDQGQRIQKIVAQLQRFADSKDDVSMSEFDVDIVIQRALVQIEARLQGIDVIIERADAVPRVSGNADLLAEALVRLFENACSAMPEGGTLTIGIDSRNGQLVALRVADTGAGIPKELQARVFEPFYTTRLQEGAKGLGLPRVNQIMEMLNGKMILDSAEGRGTVFTVLLPAVHARSFV